MTLVLRDASTTLPGGGRAFAFEWTAGGVVHQVATGAGTRSVSHGYRPVHGDRWVVTSIPDALMEGLMFPFEAGELRHLAERIHRALLY